MQVVTSLRTWQPPASSACNAGRKMASSAPHGAQETMQSAVNGTLAQDLAFMPSRPQHLRAFTSTACLMQSSGSTGTTAPAGAAAAAVESSSAAAAAAAASQHQAPKGLAAVPPIARVLGFAGETCCGYLTGGQCSPPKGYPHGCRVHSCAVNM